MKRLIVNATLFLVLVNVAVAWGFAILVNPMNGEMPEIVVELSDDRCESWEMSLQRRRGLVILLNSHLRRDEAVPDHLAKALAPGDAHALAPGWGKFDRPHDIYGPGGAPIADHRRSMGAGWPCLSLWCNLFRRVIVNNGTRYERRLDVAWASGLEPWGGMWERVLPLKPIWPGFATNTIFYAAVLWLLFAAPGLVRRRIRIKRGLCPACAYPIGAGAPT